MIPRSKQYEEEILRAKRDLASKIDISDPIIAMILTGKIPEKQETGQAPIEAGKLQTTLTLTQKIEDITDNEQNLEKQIRDTQNETSTIKENIRKAIDQRIETDSESKALNEETQKTKATLDQNFPQTSEGIKNKE